MIKLSNVHDWQGDAAVKQILVFPSSSAETAFTTLHDEEVKRLGVADASDTNKGASYKIRAVKNGDGTWCGLVRCGVTGSLLLHETPAAPNWPLAMLEAYDMLQQASVLPIPIDLIYQLESVGSDEKVS